MSKHQQALYFSRATIPYDRDGAKLTEPKLHDQAYRHLGLYAYRVLIETDSPYLAPMPYRGKSNEPKYVPYVAKALCDVYDKSLEEMAYITKQNFENLLNLK